MKKFILITKSESCDNYTYFISHKTQPTVEELKIFLKKHAFDVDENGKVYEYVEQIVEIIDDKFLTI